MTLPDPPPLIGTIGDLIEDLVVELGEPIRHATDTDVTIARRRGGSAANVAAAAIAAGGRARFIGNVGLDDVGDRLLRQLEAGGANIAVARSGKTGTVVALIDTAGERSLLTDRGSSAELAAMPVGALDGLAVLHVPAYAFTGQPLAGVGEQALLDARASGVATSVDASAVPVIEAIGIDRFTALIDLVRPRVLFCNRDEAEALGVHGRLQGTELTVVKNGPDPAVVYGPGSGLIEVPALLVHDIADTTGAGDAFAAAFMIGIALGRSPEECAILGHGLAAKSLQVTGALQGAYHEDESTP